MRLGFQYPSPFERIVHHRYGDDEWTVTIRKRGDLWLYSTVNAHAHFGPDKPAEPYTEHPGTIAVFARLHIELESCGWLDKLEHFTLGSAQVRDLIGVME